MIITLHNIISLSYHYTIIIILLSYILYNSIPYYHITLHYIIIDLFLDSDSFYNYIPHFSSERSNQLLLKQFIDFECKTIK